MAMQMQKITPFLWFNTQAEEAIHFYVSIFKGSKVLGSSRFPEGGPMPAGTFMVGSFEIEGQKFTALNGGPQYTFNNSVSFVVNCENQQEVDYYWSKLLEGGGKEIACGWLTDKFGLAWQITPTMLPEVLAGPDKAGAQRAFQAMMGMVKLDIAKLQKAYDGK